MAEKMTEVDEIQARIRDLAQTLDQAFRELEIPERIKELEKHISPDAEAMGNDEVLPSVAWKVHGGLCSLLELFEEISAVLKRTGSSTCESVQREWSGHLVEQVQDPPARILLAFLLARLQAEEESPIVQTGI